MTEWIISSSVLILAVLLLRSALRGRISPRIQYALWAIVLLRLLMPFSLFQSSLSIQNLHEEVKDFPQVQQVYQTMNEPISPTAGGQSDHSTITQPPQQTHSPAVNPIPQQSTPSDPSEHPSISATDVLTHIWLVGMGLIALWMTGCNLRFSNRLRRSRQPLDIPCSLLPVYRTGAVETPCLFGLFSPAVYLTPEAAEDDQLRNYVLTHELTHYRQFDHVWAVLRAAVLVLHWYNPLVWIAFRASRQDGEMACDEGTLKELGEAHRGNYGRTLIGLATGSAFRATMVTATSMGGTKRAMKERIVILMKNPKTALMTMVSLILACALIVGCTFTGAVDKPTEPEETVPTETTSPVETTEPTEAISLDYTPLTADQLQQANDAFAALFYDVDGNVQINPLDNFNTSYYRSPAEIDLYRFIYYFCYQGEFENLDADFDRLAMKYPELENWRNNYNMTRYPADAVDEILYKYTGCHIEELFGTRDAEGVYYLAETDAYYSFSSDAGWVGLRFTEGYIFSDCVRLYTDIGTVMTLVERNGEWFIQAYHPVQWDAPVELTEEEIDQVNQAFSSVITDEYGLAGSSPISCFFTSYYENPTQIDLVEFLRYFSAHGIVDDWASEEVTEEEYDAIRVLDGFLFDEKTDLDQLPVPIHKYPSVTVDAVIYRYTGYGLYQLEGSGGKGDAFYSEEYDAYYNFTSDFGPGFFICIGGMNYGNYIELYSENAILTLTRESHFDNWKIYSHLPKV